MLAMAAHIMTLRFGMIFKFGRRLSARHNQTEDPLAAVAVRPPAAAPPRTPTAAPAAAAAALSSPPVGARHARCPLPAAAAPAAAAL